MPLVLPSWLRALVSPCQLSNSPACWHSFSKRGAMTVNNIIVPAHVTHLTHTHSYKLSGSTEPILPTHHLFHHRESGIRFVPSENAGGRWGNWGSEEEMGWNVPAATSSPRLNTHISLHTHTLGMCVCVCLYVCDCVCVCSGDGCGWPGKHRLCPLKAEKKMTYLTHWENTRH